MQKEPESTAHALKVGMDQLGDQIKTMMVFNGDDSLFLSLGTVRNSLRYHLENNKMLTVNVVKYETGKAPPLGGLRRDEANKVISLYTSNTQAREAGEKYIETIAGFYIFNKQWAKINYIKIKKNQKGEYPLSTGYLDIVLGRGDGLGVFEIKDRKEWMSINTQEDLILARKQCNKFYG